MEYYEIIFWSVISGSIKIYQTQWCTLPLLVQVLKMCIAGRKKTMQTSYIFCPGFVTDYWQWYTACGPKWPFLFQFLYKATDFSWSYPSNRSTKQMLLQPPASHCASRLLKWKIWCSEVHTTFLPAGALNEHKHPWRCCGLL